MYRYEFQAVCLRSLWCSKRFVKHNDSMCTGPFAGSCYGALRYNMISTIDWQKNKYNRHTQILNTLFAYTCSAKNMSYELYNNSH